MVFEEAGDSSYQSLPKKLEDVVFLDVLLEAENFQIAEEGFDVTGDLAFLGIGFDDQVEPSAFEIEFAISEGEIVDFGYVQREETHGHVESGLVGKRVERH